MGKLSTTASAHKLIFDFKGGKIVASYFNFFNENFAGLVQTIDINQTDSAIRESLPNEVLLEVNFRIIKDTEWVLILKNGSMRSEEFRIFLEDLTFPLKVVFENINGELDSPSEGFAKHSTIDFSHCEEPILTQSFLSEMQGKYNTIDVIGVKETLRNELIGKFGHSVFLNDNSKFWKSKADEDKRVFLKEEPKEKENIIEKNIPKALNYVSKNGGLRGAEKRVEKDIKSVVRSIFQGKSLKKALADEFKIKEWGYKKK